MHLSKMEYLVSVPMIEKAGDEVDKVVFVEPGFSLC